MVMMALIAGIAGAGGKAEIGARNAQAVIVSHMHAHVGSAGHMATHAGGARGIGAMIARGLLDAGARIVISSRKEHELTEAQQHLSQFGEVHAIRADVSTHEGVARLAEEVSAHFPVLDILVNNAGATWGMPLDDFDEHAWDKVMDTNVKGVFFLTQKLLPGLRAAGRPGDPARVINVGSIDGLHVNPMDTYSYSASKAASDHLVRAYHHTYGLETTTSNCSNNSESISTPAIMRSRSAC